MKQDAPERPFLKPTPPIVETPPIKMDAEYSKSLGFFFWLRVGIIALITTAVLAYGVGK